LSASEKKKLYDAIAIFCSEKEYPEYAQLFNDLVAKLVTKEIRIMFKIDLNLGVPAGYDTQDQSITFCSSQYIQFTYLKEELIHAMQHVQYGSNMVTSNKSYEFEAKVFQDAECWKPGCFLEGAGGLPESESLSYNQWIQTISESGIGAGSNKFYYFCNQWNNGYSGTADPTFIPKILIEYFGK
jgi:cytochrome c oxidase assembly protein Cox11